MTARSLKFFVISLFLQFSFSTSFANTLESLKATTLETCKYYGGEGIDFYISPKSDLIRNPLTRSPLGRVVIREDFSQSYSQYNYFHTNETLYFILNSPHLNSWLEACYPGNRDAQEIFKYFLGDLSSYGKSAAMMAEGATWALGIKAFTTVVRFMKPAMTPAFYLKMTIWSKRVLYVALASHATVAIYHALNKKSVAEKFEEQTNLLVEQMEENESLVDEVKVAVIADLSAAISELKIKILQTKDPQEKEDLQKLLAESEELLGDL